MSVRRSALPAGWCPVRATSWETPIVGHAPTERSQRFDEQRERLRSRYLKAEDARPRSSGSGLHHAALVSSDGERTIRFYQDQLEFPLTELFENRDYPGSSHFFFDIGNGNLLGFFDFPNLDLGPYQEVFGGLHHVAISVEPKQWHRLRAKLMDASVGLDERSESSLYFSDPDGTRLELIADPLGELYGEKVL